MAAVQYINKNCFHFIHSYYSSSRLIRFTIIRCCSRLPKYDDSTGHELKSKCDQQVKLPQVKLQVKLPSRKITSLNSIVITPETKPLKLLNTEEEWKPKEPFTIKNLLIFYSRLAKMRLTSLVVLTTMSGYFMAVHGTVDPGILTATLLGTALTSGAAASLNQYLEIPFDSQMVRTRNRPLVVGQLSPFHAFGFASVLGVTGLSLLWYVNPLTCLLGGSNLLLYSFIYTPMKRAHIANTWVGAVVGAIPPVMGFTAANNFIDLQAILFGLLLYSWQFPHFNALSWNIRHDYARAGYRMMSVTQPSLCLNTSLRHSILIVLYCQLMVYTGLTSWTFAIDSMPFNLYLIYLSYKFKSNPDSQSSRKLFRYSLIHLPALIMLMLISNSMQKSKKNKDDQNNKIDNNNVRNENVNIF